MRTPEETENAKAAEGAEGHPVSVMPNEPDRSEQSSACPSCPFDLVLRNFVALLQEESFEQELRALGIGRLRFFRRRRAVASLQALHVALWRLALLRSFPEDGERICARFLASLRDQDRSRRTYALSDNFEQEVLEYVERLQLHGSADFTGVAAYLVSRFKPDSPDDAAARLRLILLIRNAYTTIFDHLI